MKKYLYTVLVLSLVLVLNADAKWPPVNSTVPGVDGDCLYNDNGNVGAGSCSGMAGGAPTNATYITQTANGSLSAEQALSTLSTGLMFVTTTTGVITSKVPTDNVVLVGNGTDWEAKAITDCTGSGKAVTYTAASNTFGCNTISGSGSTTFIGLTDVPASYTGQALKFTRVNAGETALEFATPSGAGTVTHTGALTASSYLVGNGTDDIKVATTQVLPRTLGGVCDAYVAPGTNNIQAVIDALPVTGGTICLDVGTYTMTGTDGIVLGNGTATTESTRHGIKIRGAGMKGNPSGAPTTAPTKIDCTDVTSVCIKVLGAENAEVSDFNIVGMHGASTYGFFVFGGRYGRYERIAIGTPNVLMHFQGGDPGGGGDPALFAFQNIVDQVEGVIDATAANGRGIRATGSATWDTLGLTVTNVSFWGNHRSDSRCFYLASAESVHVENFLCIAGPTYDFGKAITLDYSVVDYLPEQNVFINGNTGQTVAANIVEVIGTPHANSQPNRFIAVGTYDLGAVNTAPNSPYPDKVIFSSYRVSESSEGLVLPASNYINFGTGTPGTGSYGLRDNAGTMEAKNSGGSWAAIGSGGAGGDIVSPLLSSEVAITNANTALTISKMHVITATSGATTNALPACSGNTDKFIGIRISITSTKLVTVDGNASETIDGSLTRIMWAGESAIVKCDGTSWSKIAGKTIPMRAKMHENSAQDLTNGAVTTIAFDTSDIDNTGLMVDTTGHSFVIQRTGDYHINGFVYMNNGVTPIPRLLSQISNGATAIARGESSSAANSVGISSVDTLVALTAADVITLGGYQSIGTIPLLTGAIADGSSVMYIEERPSW